MAKLKLKAKHFKNTTYIKPDDCPIYRAAIEQFKLPENIYVGEGAYFLTIGDVRHRHKTYTEEHYNNDFAVAKASKFDETIIRIINLPTYEPA